MFSPAAVSLNLSPLLICASKYLQLHVGEIFSPVAVFLLLPKFFLYQV